MMPSLDTNSSQCDVSKMSTSYDARHGSVRDSPYTRQVEDGSNSTPQNVLASPTINDANDGGNLVLEVSSSSPKAPRQKVQGLDERQMSRPAFFMDSMGFEKPIRKGLPSPAIHCLISSTDSESDDEVIIFSGRNKKKSQGQAPELNIIQPTQKANNDTTVLPLAISLPTQQNLTSRAGSRKVWAPQPERTKSQKTNKPLSAGRGRLSWKAEEDAILADYISNTKEYDGANDPMEPPQLKQRDLSLEEYRGDVECFVSDEKAGEIQGDRDDWNSVDLQDFNSFSTSSDPMVTIPRIIGKRLRNSVTQYLVVAEGDSTDEARWVPPDLLKAKFAAKVINLFEEQQAKFAPLVGNDETEDDFALEAQLASDLDEELKFLEDDKDLDRRRRARMSDEHIARILSKQADLGIVGDELVLLNGDEVDVESGDDVPTASPAKMNRYSSRYSEKHEKRSTKAFSFSTAFADVLERDSYDGFDIVDQERPSLGKKPKKGRPSEAMFDLSDSDLQHSIIAAWETDRAKKKQRKQEREILRTHGLLGKTGKLNLKEKFVAGIKMDDVKREVKKFLASSRESQPLPPMGQKERKDVHGMAHQVGLKSKSFGSGVARYPILYKTSRTQSLTPDIESQIDAIFTARKFLPRSVKTRRKGMTASQDGRGSMGAPAASYRDGEIVGIGAPELGLENRGRAMLEKMGWSTGTSLGAFHNKGIAQPIEQIVKTSKAGLG